MIKLNCYVINLKRCPEKRDRIKNKLDNLKIKYTIYDAIDGQNITNEYMETNNYKVNNEWKDPYHNRKTTLGEIGCSLSHYNVMKMCLDAEYDISLIVEDDADFCDKFCENVFQALYELNSINDWDYCYLGRKKVNNDIDEELVNNNIVKPQYSYWTIGSLIHRRGCNKIVNSNFLENIIPVDEFLPLISDVSPHTEFRDIYNTSINTYSYIKNIIYPEEEAFKNSDTEIMSFLPNITEKIEEINNLKIITVATHDKEPLQRFKESCENYGLYYKILGLNQEWKGGNMKKGMGGGMKINLLRDELNKGYVDDDIILFTDSYDTIFLTGEKEILNKYYKFNSDIVFSGEEVCWPDKSKSYIFDKDGEKYKYKYINSGGFIGKVSAIKELISEKLDDNFDDQLYIHIRYNDMKRLVKIDYTCEIFQTSSFSDLNIDYGKNRITNKIYNTRPCHLHGNGSINKKITFNNYCNYLSKSWNPTYGYMKPKINISDKSVFIFIYLQENIDIYEFFLNLENIIYGNKIFYISTKKCYDYDYKFITSEHILDFCEDKEHLIRDKSLKICKTLCYDYYLNINADCIITNGDIINKLISYDKNIVAPLFRKNEYWTNFWGEIDINGWYNKSFNYFDIVNNNHNGCWNVPYINNIYLIKSTIIDDIKDFYSLNYQENRGCDMSFCENCRNNDIFMYVCNQEELGHLNNNITLYSFSDNENEYLTKYFDRNFIESIDNLDNLNIEEPINDVIQFPIVNEVFCDELINICESHDNWSGATNNDKRIGYENVPTNDIHLTQLNLHEDWNKFLLKYIAPIVSYRWGSFKTSKLNIGFIVKYDSEFKSLEPHHDSSSYTLNICLNDEFDGGEINFVKKNKTIKNKKGYCIIHPGRITHYHEALPVENGNKYVFVSFVI